MARARSTSGWMRGEEDGRVLISYPRRSRGGGEGGGVRNDLQPSRWLLAPAGLAAYLVTVALSRGLHVEHFVLVALVSWALAWSDRTRDLFVRALPLTLYGVAYDLTHLTEPLVRHLHVHVAEPYLFELKHFSIAGPDGSMTLNQYFAIHHWPWLDLLTGTAYLAFLYEALFFGIFLVWTGRDGERRQLATRFCWAFFAMNVAGFATYYLYPAAPPWYVTQWGLGPANFDVQASAAAALRWDALVGVHYFASFYGKSADVFGAIPSLHVAQPLLVFFFSLPPPRAALGGRRWRNVFPPAQEGRGGGFPWVVSWTTGLYALLVAFSAIYLQHHYLLDVVIGALYALVAYAVASRLESADGHASRSRAGARLRHLSRAPQTQERAGNPGR